MTFEPSNPPPSLKFHYLTGVRTKLLAHYMYIVQRSEFESRTKSDSVSKGKKSIRGYERYVATAAWIRLTQRHLRQEIKPTVQ